MIWCVPWDSPQSTTLYSSLLDWIGIRSEVMSKGRPEGWKNPEEGEYQRLKDSENGTEAVNVWEAYEAGADAILEALSSNIAMEAMLFGFMIANGWVIEIEAKESA